MDIVTDYTQMYKSQSRHDISSIKGVWQLVLLQKSKPKLSPVRVIFNKDSIIQQAAVTELLIIIYIKFEMAGCRCILTAFTQVQTDTPLVGLSSDPYSSVCSAKPPEEVLLGLLFGGVLRNKFSTSRLCLWDLVRQKQEVPVIDR